MPTPLPTPVAAQPNAAAEWQWVLPLARISQDPRSGVWRRHHAHEGSVSRAITQAARKSGLTKRVTTMCFDIPLQRAHRWRKPVERFFESL